MAIKKATGRAMSLPVGIAAGGIVGYLLTLILSGLLAWLMHSERIALENIGYGSMIVILLSAALGAFAAQRLVKHRKIIVCIASGAVCYVLLLATTALFFGGQYQGMGVTFGMVLAGAGSMGLIVTNRKKTITKGYRIPRTG
jgi:putative membrane protein (TIGR04086 family)